MDNKNFALRLIVILISSISPFIYMGIVGELPSISSYWESSMQPMFITVNAVTSYFFFSIDRWRWSALFLLLLTAFSVENYIHLHNIFAICFFLYNLYPMLTSKRIRWALIPYTLSIVLVFKSILYAEILAILSLCSAHLYLLIKYMSVKYIKRIKPYTD